MQREISPAHRQSMLEQAALAPRLRVHELWHPGPEDAVHRLVIAAQPGSRFMPHCHPTQWEILIPLQGSLDLLYFSAAGQLQARHALQPGDVIQLPPAQPHALYIHQPCCFFEVKPGPLQAAAFLSGFPTEAEPLATAVLDWYAEARIGEAWSA